MKPASNKFVSIVYHVSAALVPVQYLVLMGVIYMLLKTLSGKLGITVPLIIFRVFRMTNREHPCCLCLADSVPAFLMVYSASTITWSSFFAYLEEM